MKTPHLTKQLSILQFATTPGFSDNFQKLMTLLQNVPDDSFALAPEVCLSGFCYDRMEEAAQFSKESLPALMELGKQKSFALTMIEKESEGYVNRLRLFHRGEVVHTQEKYKLFPLGDEDRHFIAGSREGITIIDVGGIRIASLICFELRFTELWQQTRGADLILIPAMWGVDRVEQFQALSRALAIANQCYVVAVNSFGKAFGGGSQITDPFGVVTPALSEGVTSASFDLQTIKKMRRYVNTGLSV